jgi:ElaA protein
MNFQIKHFSELSLNEFHDLIALRLQIFVVEQNCSYLDLDGKDKLSYHVICRDGKGNCMATARILPAGIIYEEVSIGRVVTDESIRRKGEGHLLMKACMNFIKAEFGHVPIRISAQAHLEKFYNAHLFFSTGKEYLEDDIPHMEMLYVPQIIPS